MKGLGDLLWSEVIKCTKSLYSMVFFSGAFKKIA